MKKLGIIVVLSIFSFSTAMAQLVKVDQEVFGMDCAPCAYGLERGLKKMDGLQSVKVSLNNGKAYLKLTAVNDLSLQKIQKEVKNNGFSARSAEVTLNGELVKEGNEWSVHVNGETFKVSTDTSDKVLTKLKSGRLKLTGLVEDKEDDELNSIWNITITEIL
ncbi:MAG: heavy metal-associated domain-containing protein [Cyclobacteriaceae bacterium]